MALRLEPVVEQEYWGYWVKATARCTPSLQGAGRGGDGAGGEAVVRHSAHTQHPEGASTLLTTLNQEHIENREREIHAGHGSVD